jgi:predicted dinucleotide-binding enzyme
VKQIHHRTVDQQKHGHFKHLMKIAVLGTGMVGNALATKLVQVGHQVMVGSRTTKSDAGQEWLRSVGGTVQIGAFAAAAAFGELIISCTNGTNSVAALRQAGEANLRGKIGSDISNPLDTSQKPPTLAFCNTDSLGERIQREFPEAIVVRALNTVNCDVMINPAVVPGDHNLFICGNDLAAKGRVAQFIADNFSWKRDNIVDLGDISNSRGTEMYLALWIRLWGKLGTPLFNIHIVRA